MNFWLMLLLVGVLGACGGSDGDDGEPAVCGNGIVESGEECDFGDTEDGDGCSSTCQWEPGWSCDEEGNCEEVEICDDGIDNTGNGLVDCDDPTCDTSPSCRTDCSDQASCGGGATDRSVAVCAAGICRTATSYDSEGNVLLGQAGVYNQFTHSTNTASLRSWAAHVFHPALPGSGEELTCETLMERSREVSLDIGQFNVVRSIVGQFGNDTSQNYLIRLADVPATSDTSWLVLIRMYAGPLQAAQGSGGSRNEPSGRMIALSCVEDFANPPGQWDPARGVSTTAEPACTDDSHCAPGWSCLNSVGYCVYQRCDPSCEPGFVCRELSNGDPACLRSCDDQLTFCTDPAYPRCDKTPGWPPACFEG